jgi:hypothetical protein
MNLRPRIGLLYLVTVALAACGGDDGAGEIVTPDAGPGDTGEDVSTDSSIDTADSSNPDSVEPDALPDAAQPDVEPDVVDEPCPGSILCFDERTGNPSSAVCANNGFPAGTTCVEESETVACCVLPFACETDADCEANRAIEGFCPDERFPCACQPDGSCVTDICSADSECADGEVCSSGRCAVVDPSLDRTARILTRTAYLQPGDTLSLQAVAVSVDDVRVTDPTATIEWAIESGTGSTISTAGEFIAGDEVSTIVVRATLAGEGDPGDSVTIYTLGPVAENTSRVIVVDEATREPVSAAFVYRVPLEGEDERAGSDANGVVTFGDSATSMLHVIANGYAYVSVVSPVGDTLLVALPPIQTADITEVRDGFVCDTAAAGTTLEENEQCGDVGQVPCLCYDLEGVDVARGVPDFVNVPGDGELDVAISGFSLGNALLDLNFDLIVGPEITRIPPEDSPIPLDDEIGIPSGVSLYYNNSPFVDSFIGTSSAGERVMWSIGGTVFLSDVLVEILPSLGGDLAFGPIIAALLPIFDDFYSGISAPLDLSSTGTFPVRDPGIVLDVPTQRRLEVTVPQLPVIGSGWSDTVIILGGALMPGEGFVPMGITGGTDVLGTATPDGFVDADQNTEAIEALGISMAPIHGAIDTPFTQYMLASVALRLDESGTGPREATSGILSVLPVGSSLPTEVAFGREAFPQFVVDASWDGSDGVRRMELGSREEPVDMYRVVFQGPAGRNWVVYADGDADGFTLPTSLNGTDLQDRAASGRVNVIALSFNDESGVDFDSLLDADGRDLMDLFAFIEGFSILGL